MIFGISCSPAPAMIGVAIRKEKFAASCRSRRRKRAVVMVEPERDTPGMIASDRRLKAASNALMARIAVDGRSVTLDAASNGKPALAPANSVDYSVRDQSGRLLLGDAHIPAVSIADASAQMLAVVQLDGRSMRALTTRFDTPAGILIVTTVDLTAGSEPAARYAALYAKLARRTIR